VFAMMARAEMPISGEKSSSRSGRGRSESTIASRARLMLFRRPPVGAEDRSIGEPFFCEGVLIAFGSYSPRVLALGRAFHAASQHFGRYRTGSEAFALSRDITCDIHVG
jgi:hypothetical protein